MPRRGGGPAAILKLESTFSLEWTNTSTTVNQSTSTQIAALTMGGPAYGYSGPILITAYWDNIYSSFMFAYTEPE